METDQVNPGVDDRFGGSFEGTEGDVARAAFDAIADLGIARATTRAIAAKGQLNPALVNYYFRSKRKLLTRMYQVVTEAFSATVEKIAEDDRDDEATLRKLLEEPRGVVDSAVFRVQLAFWAESVVAGGEIGQMNSEVLRRWRASVDTVIARGAQEGRFSPSLDGREGQVMVALMIGLCIQRALDPASVVDGDLDRIADWVVGKLAGQSSP